MSVYPELDAKRILRPILQNYNSHVLKFVRLLDDLSCQLFYDGPSEFRDHVRDKTVYACSIRVWPTTKTTKRVAREDRDADGDEIEEDGGEEEDRTRRPKRKAKVLKCVFPIMIGSDLDHCVRKRGVRTVSEKELSAVDFLDDVDESFGPADVAASFFVVNGCVRQVPFFFTNDPTNAHVVRGGRETAAATATTAVRCYAYDADDRGKELTYFAERSEKRGGPGGGGGNRLSRERGDVEVVLNDGTSVLNDERGFFEHCPHRTEQAAYMEKVYRDGEFDIDNIANKVIVSPGHLFTKLFVKYLYRPLKNRDWPAVKSKHSIVVRSIESGALLHVLSKKTTYYRDQPSTMTVINPTAGNFANAGGGSTGNAPCQPSSNVRSGDRLSRSGGGDGDVYVEKNTGCYREVTMQTYPLNPYLSHLITRQVSSKVSPSNIVAYHPSYVGFLCMVATFETKNIGRTGVMVRDTAVSIGDDVRPVYDSLRLEVSTPHEGVVCERTPGKRNGKRKRASPRDPRRAVHYVVVNEACVPVTKACFERVCRDLEDLKSRFGRVECRRKDNFVLVRYKTGLFFKKLRRRGERDGEPDDRLWVTAGDEAYWKRRCGRGRLRPPGFAQVTSHLTDLNPFFNHNDFTKNILAFNTLKSAVLSTDPSYSDYFMETLSAYAPLTPRHRTVCRPADPFSRRFALRVPLLSVAYVSHLGLNQEDSIVVHRDVRSFDCYRFHTVRLKFETPSRRVAFHPVTGDPDPEGRLLGNLVCHDPSLSEFRVVPQTMHVRLEPVVGGGGAGRHQYRIHFNRTGFAIRNYVLTESRLVVCLERFHECRTGDKLTSFHGQKGIIRIVDSMPVFGRVADAFGNVSSASVDVLVNPYCLFRMTLGQIREALFRGGRDHGLVWNSGGKSVPVRGPYGVFVGENFYLAVNYFAEEHSYVALFSNIDRVQSMPIRGRSRGGGMRIGNMEMLNGMRGNGLSACYEEKALEHSDRIFRRAGRRRGKKRKRDSSSEKVKEEAGDRDGRVALSCDVDVLSSMPTRGRSRAGGARIGNMEMLNGTRGDEPSDGREEKALRHSDEMFSLRRAVRRNEASERKSASSEGEKANAGDRDEKYGKRKRTSRDAFRYTLPMCKSTLLTKEDVAFYKVRIKFRTENYFEEMSDSSRAGVLTDSIRT